MKRKHPYEIVPYLYDVNTVEYRVRDKITGRIIADCCASMAEAEREIEAELEAMDRFNDGPFSAAQCARVS